MKSLPPKPSPAPITSRSCGGFLFAIGNARDHGAALAVLDKLIGFELTKGQAEYMNALATLVEQYESEHEDDAGDPVPPAEMLRALMQNRQMGRPGLVKLLGSDSAASGILNGKRPVSRSQAKILADHFRVDVGVFL